MKIVFCNANWVTSMLSILFGNISKYSNVKMDGFDGEEILSYETNSLELEMKHGVLVSR